MILFTRQYSALFSKELTLILLANMLASLLLVLSTPYNRIPVIHTQHTTISIVTGRDTQPVLFLTCHLENNKMWKDPKSLLPHVKSVISCAGAFSHYEWETRNGKRIARLNINLDYIEFIAKTSHTATTAPINM